MQPALNFIIFRNGVLTGEMVFDKLLYLGSNVQSYGDLPIWRYGAVYAERILCPASLSRERIANYHVTATGQIRWPNFDTH
jgi:hypothetical protein